MTVITDQIRILIVDDHPVEGLDFQTLLDSHDNIEIIGSVGAGSGAVDEVRRSNPDVVILNGAQSDNAIDTTRHILDASAQTEVLVVAREHSAELAQQVLQAGARAYVIESDGLESVIAAIAALRRHKPFLTGELAEDILDSYIRLHQTVDGEAPRLPKITPREREIIQLLCEGNSNKETALRLGISVKTVEAHRLNIMRKLRLTSLSHLVRYAIREGIVAA
jgi:DNA-binding NarL/FixJ family response regulator